MITNRKLPTCVTLRAARVAAPPGAPGPQPHPPEDLCRLVASESVARREVGRPRGLPATRLSRHEYRLPVFGSFSIEDAGAPVPDIPWGEREEAQLFSAGEGHVLVWAPDEARASLVVELRDTPPGDEDLGEWDHVAEFPLAVPSGRLVVLTDVVGPIPELPVHPGPHRVRLHVGGLAGVGEEDGRPVGGFVRYRLALWPRDPAAAVVLKPREGAASPGRDRPFPSANPAAPGDGAGGGRGADLGGRVEWALGAGDVDEFVARVFHRMQGALMDLEELLDALQGDARVGTEHRHALAAELDHIKFAHLEEWVVSWPDCKPGVWSP